MPTFFTSMTVLLLISARGAAQTQTTVITQKVVPVVRFLAPQPGEKIQQSAITVRYAIDQPQAVAASTPSFNLRLDGRDPVNTEEKESTFTGLAPGTHTLAIDVVDANGTPIAGTHSEIQFTVALEPPASAPIPAPSATPATPAQNNQTAPPARKRKKKPPQNTQPPQASLPIVPLVWDRGFC